MTLNKKPLISIITIVYNGDEYLEQCIRSIRNQSYKNIEYIIIDGGSKDRSIDIIKANIDIVTSFISEKDNGISDAFNKGIKRANGDLVGILNSDDMYLPDTIEKLVESYSKNKGKDGVYYGDIQYFNDSIEYELVPDLSKVWKYMSIYHPAVFVSNSVYNKIGGFSEEYKYAMDVEFIHRALYNRVSFYYVAATLTRFRLGGTSGINYRGSYREFYKSVMKYNPISFAKFYYYLGITKKFILSTSIGTLLQKNRARLKIFMSGNDKK